MAGRTKAIFPFSGADALKKAASSVASVSASPPPSQERSMSVDDFRRLVQELYLDSEPSTDVLQAGIGALVHNVAILVDTSGSMERDDPHLAQLKNSLERFAAKIVTYAERGIRLNVCLIGFSEKITAFFAVDNFTAFRSQIEDPFYKAIYELRACGGTNYQAAFHKAGAWFAEHADEQASSAVFFITDGKPTCYYHDAFTHSIASSKSGVYVYNGTEFAYGGKGRAYYDANGRIVGSNSAVRRYRASEEGAFEVRVGSSLNWFATKAVFAPDSPARRICCTLPEYYVPGQAHYFDASGNSLPDARRAAYRISASGNFEQYRRGAWHDPVGTVIATALDAGGAAHSNFTTKVQGGSGVSSGALEVSKSLHACRKIVDSTQRLSLYALGIGSAVDSSMLNAFDTAARAQVLLDTSMLVLALIALVDADCSAVLPEHRPEGVQDAFHAHDHSIDSGFSPEHAPHGDTSHHYAASGEHGEHTASFHSDSSLLSAIGSDLLGDNSELDISGSFASTPVEGDPGAVVRHFSLGDTHLGLHELFGEHATVDDLLSRITASQEIRTVNGEIFENVVLHLHAGDDIAAPVIQTIVLEGFAHVNHDTPGDLQTLLHHLLHS